MITVIEVDALNKLKALSSTASGLYNENLIRERVILHLLDKISVDNIEDELLTNFGYIPSTK